MDQTTDITPLLELIISLIVAPFIPIAVYQLKRWIDANTSKEQQAAVIETVRLAVLAAEQMGLSGDEAKLTAVRYAEAQLAAQGISADFERLSVLVEALVMDEFNRWKIDFGRTNGG